VEDVVEISPGSSNELMGLAARYVDQYLKQSGRTLSAEDREAKIENVYNFYSAPSRSGRLEQIVFG
ncbi:MAG: hypothetical protein MUF23_05670, partial [Pirellula sp.]|nr:hypothetical protein [Pirellula sp.]